MKEQKHIVEKRRNKNQISRKNEETTMQRNESWQIKHATRQ
jgi:hypothetical protein